jgi:DNA polymerase III alpha subunit
MAWLSIADPSGSVECGLFPNAYQRLGQPTVLLREGAFLVARGRLAHEESTGTKVWIEHVVILGKNSQFEALKILTHANGGRFLQGSGTA